jgi:ribosomal protein L12E/L44/L45/RPP1/RPP2
MQNPIGSISPSTKALKSVNGLQEENARLKDLVVTLSSLVLKNVVHEFRNNVHSVASRVRKHPRSNAEEQEIAEALEAAGHELMAKAVKMKSVLNRRKWK